MVLERSKEKHHQYDYLVIREEKVGGKGGRGEEEEEENRGKEVERGGRQKL